MKTLHFEVQKQRIGMPKCAEFVADSAEIYETAFSFDVAWDGIPDGGAASWNDLADKPFESIGENLKVVGGALTVDTAPNVQQDNTKPITSAAVYTEVGNINALLALI